MAAGDTSTTASGESLWESHHHRCVYPHYVSKQQLCYSCPGSARRATDLNSYLGLGEVSCLWSAQVTYEVCGGTRAEPRASESQVKGNKARRWEDQSEAEGWWAGWREKAVYCKARGLQRRRGCLPPNPLLAPRHTPQPPHLSLKAVDKEAPKLWVKVWQRCGEKENGTCRNTGYELLPQWPDLPPKHLLVWRSHRNWHRLCLQWIRAGLKAAWYTGYTGLLGKRDIFQKTSAIDFKCL